MNCQQTLVANQVEQALIAAADPKVAQQTQKFFKTSVGGYAENAMFLGIRVPLLRRFCRQFPALSLNDYAVLLSSPLHEVRHFAVLSLVEKYQRHSDDQFEIYRFYLAHSEQMNNWDLVDCSAHKIVGHYLLQTRQTERPVLYELAQSSNLWQRRIAMVATWAFISNNLLDETFSIAKLLLTDKADLIQKAVGWMLREAGKKDELRLKDFLKNHYSSLSRTTLRYAIEKFSESDRKKFLQAEFV